MENAKIRALIVDDEPLARKRLVRILSADPEVEVVGECANGSEAMAAIRERAPDIVFLDVQMPEMDGFAALQGIGAERMPLVIFVTAYDQYAVRAFEVYALDYLLKPFDRERFQTALQRAKAQLRLERGGDLSYRTLALLEELKTRPHYCQRLVIKTAGRIFFLQVEEIDWIEAEGKYARLHVRKDSYLIREAMSSLETRLDPEKFLRIHRSTIVNINRIKELQPWFHHDYRIILQDGTCLELSRGYRKKLADYLGRPL